MQRFYSRLTQSTYFVGVHSDIPVDAIPITEELYRDVIAERPPGKVRAHDENGLPYLVDVEPPDPVTQEREWRNVELSSVMWLRERHRDQVEMSEQTTLTAEQFAELLAYIQALRDWPQSPAFPDSEQRPAAPDWIAYQTQ
ncbi:phage tail protein [Pseudomonas syringae]|nr:phage tail protein [Pseudomonas syringae]MCF5070542.1 phage tail protein [Pseudomonas syringae]